MAQAEAGWAAHLERGPGANYTAEEIKEETAYWKSKGNCLFVFARVCKEWRKAQLKVGGPLCTRVGSDVLMPGRVELAKWALAEGCPRHHRKPEAAMIPDNFARVAAGFGHLELVKWLCREQGFATDSKLMMNAVFGGNLELVRWLHGEGCESGYITIDTCCLAARGGHLEVLRWLLGKGCSWDEEVCAAAGMGGHLQVLQWLRAEGCPWDAQTCFRAAERGHLEVLRWARENGCPGSDEGGACAAAAHCGTLDVLQCLRAAGYPWDIVTCHYAAEQGHVETLRWARENGCPWTMETRNLAAAELGYTDDFGNVVG